MALGNTHLYRCGLSGSGERVDLHQRVWDADHVHSVHHTLNTHHHYSSCQGHRLRQQNTAGWVWGDLTPHPCVSVCERIKPDVNHTCVWLTVWTPCHRPASRLKSKTFVRISPKQVSKITVNILWCIMQKSFTINAVIYVRAASKHQKSFMNHIKLLNFCCVDLNYLPVNNYICNQIQF